MQGMATLPFIVVVLANPVFDFKFPVILAVSSDTVSEKDFWVSTVPVFLQRNGIQTIPSIDSFTCFLILLLPALSEKVADPDSLGMKLEGAFSDAALQHVT